jgi:hypothetical protein
MIYGFISYDSVGLGMLGPIDYKVWLINYDAVNGVLTAVDSTTASTYTSSSQAPYWFSNASYGTYLVKAAVITGTNQLLPSYHTNDFYWSTATQFSHSSAYTVNINIGMLSGTPGAGPGFVAGNVSQGANKGTADGDPVAGLLIVLQDASGEVVRFTYTDANGNYSFSGIPVGSYSVFPESMNYVTIPSGTLNVATGQTSFNGVNFKQTQTHIKPIPVGVDNLPERSLFSVYPNPSKGDVHISWASANSEETVQVVDMTGRNVFSVKVTTHAPTVLHLSHLQPGIYFIKATDDSSRHTEKLVIQ